MRNDTTHRPDGNSGQCVCGGEEQYFEDSSPPGYGCEVAARTYERLLDRRGWHIPSHRERIYDTLTDEDENALTDDEFDRYLRYQEQRHHDRWRGRRG
jgi:hypothetical protein